MTNPLVTVVMPVYNGLPFLKDAVNSILNQTLTDFEFLIVEDASTDGSREWLHSLQDPRIRLIQFGENKGIGIALQEGMSAARGEFVARMDSDDVAVSHRLSYQTGFMAANPSVGLLGGSYDVVDESGLVSEKVIKDETDGMIRWKSMFKNPLVHSTVMIRRSILKEHNLTYAQTLNQDYSLWTRIMKHSTARILPEKLIDLRRHSNSLTSKHAGMKWQLQIQHSFLLTTELLGDRITMPVGDYSRFYEWVRDKGRDVSKADRREFTDLLMRILVVFWIRNRPVERAFFRNEFRKIVRRTPRLSIDRFLVVRTGIPFLLNNH